MWGKCQDGAFGGEDGIKQSDRGLRTMLAEGATEKRPSLTGKALVLLTLLDLKCCLETRRMA